MKRLSQKARILEALNNRKLFSWKPLIGMNWVHFSHLNDICFRYGARIFDLRRDGHNIETKQVKGVFYYKLKPTP